MPWATSCIRPAQLVRFIQERSFRKPPVGGVLSSDGGIATREQALRACTCCNFINVSPCKGALKASMYLFRSVKRLKYLWERLPKGTVLRVQANVFPPTMTKTLINLQLEVVTLTGEGGE